MKKYLILTKYAIIVNDDTSEPQEFSSIAAAEKEIKRESLELYKEANEILVEDNNSDEWGEPHYIVEIIKTVRPIPTVKLGMNLREIAE